VCTFSGVRFGLSEALPVEKNPASITPLIHRQRKFNLNFFDQKFAHVGGKVY
jgi:hypothetical protein